MSDIKLLRVILERLIDLEEKRTIFFKGGLYVRDKQVEMDRASAVLCDAIREALTRLKEDTDDATA